MYSIICGCPHSSSDTRLHSVLSEIHLVCNVTRVLFCFLIYWPALISSDLAVIITVGSDAFNALEIDFDYC